MPVAPPWNVIAKDSGMLVIESHTPELRRLWTAARLAGSREFLRLGWLFLRGTCVVNERPTRVFLPVASATVRLRRPFQAADRQRYTIVGEAELSVPESVFADHRVRQHLNDRLEHVVRDAFLRADPDEIWAGVEPFLAEFCDAAGLPQVGALSTMAVDEPLPEGELALLPGLAVYTGRDLSVINLESTLREWADHRLATTALARLYSAAPLEPLPDLDHAVANSLPLNRTQEEAILAARHLPVTVISGPPGTGKSHTAAALAIDQVAHGKSVLIAAESNDAIDAIEALLDRFTSPRHVRFGSPASRKRIAVELADGLAASTQRTAAPGGSLEVLEQDLERIEAAVRGRLELERDLTAALTVRRKDAWCLGAAPGLARVLASERTASQVESLMGRWGRRALFAAPWRAYAQRQLCQLLEIAPGQLDELVDPIRRLVNAERAVRRAQAVASQSITAAFHQLEEKAQEVRTLFGRRLEIMRTRRSWDPGATRAVGMLATALRSGRAARRQALRTIDVAAALNALPLWLGTISDIDDVLPIRPGMFDVVIIDEASQVNQVRAATSLARGDRVVVIGDPRQLRHVSFVGDDAMRAAALETDLEPSMPLLDIRRNSLFDVAASRSPVIQLTEHYRSTPHLIGFSNREFYQGRIQLMTAHPSTATDDPIDIEVVAGSRDSSGVVPAEIERALELVGCAGGAGASSVGVISPFRTQADALAKAAQEAFSADEIEQLDLRVGTVHTFQGNERDLVIVSLGIDPANLRPLRFVEDPNLFNVMITRARNRLTMLTSLRPDELPHGLLAAFLEHASRPPADPKLAPGPMGGWTAAVAEALRPFGLKTWHNYPVGSYHIDIVVGEGDAALGVECEIHHDGVDAHIARHVALRRAGWELMTAMESRWLAQPEEAAQAIAQRAVLRSSQSATNDQPAAPLVMRPNDAGGQ